MNGWWLWVGSGRVRVGARKEHTRPHSPLTTFALAHPVRFVHYAHYAHTFRSLSLTTFAHFTRYARSGPGFTPAFGSSPWLLRYVPLRSLTSPRSHSLVHFAHYVRYATVTPAHSLPTPFASLTRSIPALTLTSFAQSPSLHPIPSPLSPNTLSLTTLSCRSLGSCGEGME